MKKDEVVRLFDTYSDDLFRFAVSYVGSKHDAEDVVQDVFLKLLGKHVVLEEGREKAYLMTMTANKCKDCLRAFKRKNQVDLDPTEIKNGYFPGFSERNIVVYDEMMRLDEKYRLPIYLYFYAGYPYKEIAKILSISESAVAMRISRGKDQMRIRLEEE